MTDLSQFEARVEMARSAFAQADATSDPQTGRLFQDYWELLRDYNYAWRADAQQRLYASREAQEVETPEGDHVLAQVLDEEHNEAGLLPKWFADRARETWGEAPLTEDRLWQLLAIDNWRNPRWVSALSPGEALDSINTLLAGPMLLQEQAVSERAPGEETEEATVAPADGTEHARRHGGQRRPARDHSELLNKLTEGVAALASSDEWQRHLQMQARFHHYSAQNVDLILIQKPEATQVAGFETWHKLGRFPNKGTGIRILAPMIHRDTDDETGEHTSSIRGFRFVNVFDVSDTYGEPLPEVTKKIEGQDSGHLFELLAGFAPTIGFSVIDHDFPENGPNGDCNFTDKVIRVRGNNSGAQRVKTLAHEFAHALLHEDSDNRALGELEAESTAFVVCQALGIDSGVYSFGYVAGWANGGDEAIANIKKSSARIQKTADRLLAHCEQQFELTLDQELDALTAAVSPEGELTPTEATRQAIEPERVLTDTRIAQETTAAPGQLARASNTTAEPAPKPGIAELRASVEVAKLEVQMRRVESEIASITSETALREATEEVDAREDDLDRALNIVASLRAGVVLEGNELKRFEREVRAEVARAERIMADHVGGDPREFASRRLGQSILELRRAHKDARPVSEERERLRIQLEGAEKAHAVVIDENAHPAILEAVITNVALDNEMDPEWLRAQKIVLERDAMRAPALTHQPGQGILI